MKKPLTYRHSEIRPFHRGYLLYDETGQTGNLVAFTPNKVRSGTKNPQWESQIKSLIDATTTYSCKYGPFIPAETGPLILDRPVNWKWVDREWVVSKYRSWTTRMEGYPHRDNLTVHASTNANYASEISAVTTLAKLAFLGKLREAESSFSSLTFIGELKETVGMIRHPLKGILNATKQYKRRLRRLERVRSRFLRRYGSSNSELARRRLALMLNRSTAILENAYLQWTYGVAPFLGDIESICETAERLVGKESKVVRLSVTVPYQLPITSFTALSIAGGPGRVVFSTTTQEVPVLKVRFRGAVKVNIDPPESLERLRILSRFDLSQVVPTVYELVPFSFVLDYVSTVGDVVNGVFTSTRNLVYSTQSTAIESKRLSIVVGLPSRYGAPLSWPYIPAVGLSEYKTLNRVKANLAVNFRDLQLTIPGMDQIRNMVVLGSSLLRSFRER